MSAALVPFPFAPANLTRRDVTVARGPGGWVSTKAYDELVGSVRRERHPSWPESDPIWVAVSHDGRMRMYADSRAEAVERALEMFNTHQCAEAYRFMAKTGRITT